MASIHVELNQLIIDNVKVVFKYQIKDYLQLPKILIVLLEGNENENVYGYSYEGLEIWKISLRGRVDEKSFSPFTGIHYINGKVLLNNWNSFNCVVDPSTGEIQDVFESR